MVTFKMTNQVQKRSFSHVYCERCPNLFKFTHELHLSIHYQIPEWFYLERLSVKFEKSNHPPLNAVDPEMTILTRSFMKNVPILFKFTHELHFSIHYRIPESVYLEKFCVKFEKSSNPLLNATDPEMDYIFTRSNMKNVSILFKFSTDELHFSIY